MTDIRRKRAVLTGLTTISLWILALGLFVFVTIYAAIALIIAIATHIH